MRKRAGEEEREGEGEGEERERVEKRRRDRDRGNKNKRRREREIHEKKKDRLGVFGVEDEDLVADGPPRHELRVLARLVGPLFPVLLCCA